jgi:hypothetical protein
MSIKELFLLNKTLKKISNNDITSIIIKQNQYQFLNPRQILILNFLPGHILSINLKSHLLNIKNSYLSSSINNLKCCDSMIKNIHQFPNKIQGVIIYENLTFLHKKPPQSIKLFMVLSQPVNLIHMSYLKLPICMAELRVMFDKFNKKKKFALKTENICDGMVKIIINKI